MKHPTHSSTHEYARHHEMHVGRRRAHKLVHGKEYARGGHSDEAADRSLFKKMIHEHEQKVHGHKGKHRQDKFARGGRTKKHGDVNIAIVTPHRQGATPVPVPAGAPPPMPAGPPPGMGAGPPGMPPGLPPGGPPMGLRARGGRAYKHGGHVPGGAATKSNLKGWANYAKHGTHLATGGKVKMTAGAATGVGREEQAHSAKRRGHQHP